MSEKEFSEADFDKFVRQFSEYLDTANESKKRGNNDYNPLKAVQNPNDEVNMHSGFLLSLLDTRGEHYQDDLFLKLFLQTLGLESWFGETKNAQVFKEKKNIDIHINNGEKHIIIENKIWSGDQDGQIARYIDEIHGNFSDDENDESVSYENIAVVYLSPFGREPSPNSLCLKDKNIKWQIKGNLLEFNENKVKYKQISYQIDILAWIKECQKEVGNITSLNLALEFYKDIVKIITNQKDSKMDIAGFFGENAGGIKELPQEKRFEIAFEIINSARTIRDKYIEYELKQLQKEKEFGDWKVLNPSEFNSNYGRHIICGNYGISKIIYNQHIQQQVCKLVFCIQTDTDRRKIVIGFLVKTDKNANELQDYPQQIYKKIGETLKPTKLNYWLWHYNESDWQNLDNLKIINYFKKYYNLVNQLNEKLKTFKI